MADSPGASVCHFGSRRARAGARTRDGLSRRFGAAVKAPAMASKWVRNEGKGLLPADAAEAGAGAGGKDPDHATGSVRTSQLSDVLSSIGGDSAAASPKPEDRQPAEHKADGRDHAARGGDAPVLDIHPTDPPEVRKAKLDSYGQAMARLHGVQYQESSTVQPPVQSKVVTAKEDIHDMTTARHEAKPGARSAASPPD